MVFGSSIACYPTSLILETSVIRRMQHLAVATSVNMILGPPVSPRPLKFSCGRGLEVSVSKGALASACVLIEGEGRTAELVP